MARKAKSDRTRKIAEPREATPPARRPAGFWHSHQAEICICLGLAAATLLVFAQVRNFNFISLDDGQNIFENAQVKSGLTAKSVTWALTVTDLDYWHPLPWLSHMLDVQLFGMEPGWHHLTSVYIHILTVLVLFLVLRRMTGAIWRSAIVAALFAIHPLRAESVAWVTERKDVLGGLFWWLTTWAYVEYAKRSFSWRRYALVVAMFVLALAAKPVVMTLPFFLLLLDYWPLKRGQPDLSPFPVAGNATAAGKGDRSGCPLLTTKLSPEGTTENSPRRKPWVAYKTEESPGTGRQKSPDALCLQLFRAVGTRDRPHILINLLREKLPLFALSGFFIFLTFKSQRQIGTTEMAGHLSFAVRIANSIVSYATYLLNAVWPYPLAAIYPYNEHLPVCQVVAAGLLLVAVTALVIWKAVRFPYLAVGWFWYLGVLVPVIGLVQMGFQSRADRFTYTPLIGFFLMIVWLLHDLMSGWRHRRAASIAMCAIVLPALAARAWSQVSYWHDSLTLFEQNISVAPDNKWALNNLGWAYFDTGQVDKAIATFSRAAQLDPTEEHVQARDNLGVALAKAGRLPEALASFDKALRLTPRNADAHANRAMVLVRTGRLDEAVAEYQAALRLGLSAQLTAETRTNLGTIFLQRGAIADAIAQYSEALRLSPHYALAHLNLAKALIELGRKQAAMNELYAVLSIEPDNQKALEMARSLGLR
jgi:Tfp pilus assembly protein PilF